MMFWQTFWLIFVRSPVPAPPCRPPPPLPLGFTAITDHPRAGEARPGYGPKSGVAPVWIPIGFRSRAVKSAGGGWFTVGPGLTLFLSGLLAPHRSGHVPETGSLYSTITHHTQYSFRGPGSFNLDLIGLLLLVRKWGLVLPHPVRDLPRGSQFN